MTDTNPEAIITNAVRCGLSAETGEAIARYINHHISGGDFLDAVFSDSLVSAFDRADTGNQARLKNYAHFLYNYAPRGCWGSKAIVKAWLAQRPEVQS